MLTLSVVPSKHIYDALIQDVDARLAISDLVDNAIDNWKVEGEAEPLKIEISISSEKIKMKDNSGGIDKDTLPLLLMPGGTNRSGGQGIKGIWGVGSKRALFSLARKFTISTRRKGEVGLVLPIGEEWFLADEEEDKWQIEYKEDTSLPEGVTTIEMVDLKVILNDYSIDSIRKKLIETYRDEISDGTLTIIFNGDEVRVFPEVPWAKSSYAPPARYKMDIPVNGNGRTLNFEALAGIMVQPGEEYSYGIDLVGNKRVILKNNLDWKMGFSKERLGLPHPTINRFKAVVRVNGDSRDIPWNSSKNDINPNHPMYVPIVDQVFQISRQYVSFLRKNYEVTSKLFTQRAKEDDIRLVSLEYGREFRKVVQEYEEPRQDITISFPVPEEEYVELVRYFGLSPTPRRAVGLFLFNRILEKEVRGIVED